MVYLSKKDLVKVLKADLDRKEEVIDKAFFGVVGKVLSILLLLVSFKTVRCPLFLVLPWTLLAPRIDKNVGSYLGAYLHHLVLYMICFLCYPPSFVLVLSYTTLTYLSAYKDFTTSKPFTEITSLNIPAISYLFLIISLFSVTSIYIDYALLTHSLYHLFISIQKLNLNKTKQLLPLIMLHVNLLLWFQTDLINTYPNFTVLTHCVLTCLITFYLKVHIACQLRFETTQLETALEASFLLVAIVYPSLPVLPLYFIYSIFIYVRTSALSYSVISHIKQLKIN